MLIIREIFNYAIIEKKLIDLSRFKDGKYPLLWHEEVRGRGRLRRNYFGFV
jgi:hypothetical protein